MLRIEPKIAAPAVGPALPGRIVLCIRAFGKRFCSQQVFVDAPRHAACGHMLAPLFGEALLWIEHQALSAQLLEIFLILYRELDELRHAGITMLLELAHQNAFMIDIGDGAIVLFDDGVFEFRHWPIIRIDAHDVIHAEVLVERLTLVALRPPDVQRLLPGAAGTHPAWIDGLEFQSLKETLAR